MIVVMEQWRTRKIGDVLFGLLAGFALGVVVGLSFLSVVR